jgi:hypothetical protein
MMGLRHLASLYREPRPDLQEAETQSVLEAWGWFLKVVRGAETDFGWHSARVALEIE